MGAYTDVCDPKKNVKLTQYCASKKLRRYEQGKETAAFQWERTQTYATRRKT